MNIADITGELASITGCVLYAASHRLDHAGFERLLLEHPGCYIEIRANVLLAFRPEQEFESPEAIAEPLTRLTARALSPAAAGEADGETRRRR